MSKERTIMTAALRQQRFFLAIIAAIAGIAVCWLTTTPFGLLAPVVALYLYAGDRAVPLLRATWGVAFAGAAIVAFLFAHDMHDLMLPWATFFALALCIGEILAAKAPGLDRADAVQAMRIIESMPAYTWSASPDGHVTYVSGSTLSYLGELADKVGLFHILDNAGWRRAIHPDDYAGVMEKRRHSLVTGVPFDAEYRVRRGDGIYRWFRSFGALSSDDQGRVAGWYGTMIDIEEQKQAEAALCDRERELSQLVDIVPVHIRRLTPEGEPIFFNKRLTDFFGLGVADLGMLGSSRMAAAITDLVHPDDSANLLETVRHSVATGDPYSMKYRMRRADGAYRWVDGRAEPVRDESGAITQWYSISIDIEDEVHAQQALRESERSLQQLIDTVPALIWCLSPDGNPTYFSKRMVEYTGTSIAQLGPVDADRFDAMVKAIIYPDDAIAVTDAVQGAVMTGESFSLKHRLRRSDGVYRWVEARAEPMRDAEGTIVQWYGLCFDIDAQMHTEEALRQSEQQLRQLADTVPVQIWCVTPTGEPAYINKAMMDYIGMELEDFDAEGGAIQDLVHPDDRDALFGALSHSFGTGEPFALRFRNRRGDGVYRWQEGRADPLRDDSGQIIRWYGVNVDIDDQLATQEALRERERFLWQLVETLPAMIDCGAPNGEPVYRSRRLREFLGYELEELDEGGKSRLAGTLDAGVHPDDLAGVKEKYAHSLSTGEPYARRHRLRRFDGEYRWVETRAAAMQNAEGAIVQWNVMCMDIDGEVRAEEELRLAQARLARASQAASLAELSASIAHEVNQPLAAVVANSHACQRWLKAEPPNIERALRTVERILRDANGAADVVSRIRALFRQSLETRGSAVLGSVIAEVRDLMAEEAARRSVRMDVEVENELPLVAVDRVQVQQVLINLIRNGMEAMDAVAGDRVLRVRVRRAAELVQTEIRDRGEGVELPDRIFEPFFTTKAHGMGMGLAICRSIIESHGGKLWVEANESPGAAFIFTLPIEAKAAP